VRTRSEFYVSSEDWSISEVEFGEVASFVRIRDFLSEMARRSFATYSWSDSSWWHSSLMLPFSEKALSLLLSLWVVKHCANLG